MSQIREFTDVELFEMFNVDLGELTNNRGQMLYGLGWSKPAPNLVGVDLWEVTYRRSKVDKDTLSRQDLNVMQAEERAQRVARMAEYAETAEAQNIPLSNFLAEPKYADV